MMEVLKKEQGAARNRALNALAGIGPKAKDALSVAQALFKEAPLVQRFGARSPADAEAAFLRNRPEIEQLARGMIAAGPAQGDTLRIGSDDV